MISKYAKPMHEVRAMSKSRNVKQRHEQILNIIESIPIKVNNILDIGEKSVLTEKIEKAFDCTVENTSGDLDETFKAPNDKYDVIVFSHVIEHLFNPLHALVKLKERMTPDSYMIIALPQRGKLLWTDTHFHEIDTNRMRTLLNRANLDIVNEYKFKVYRNFSFYLKGLRPLMRFFFEYNKIYVVKLESDKS